jgi:hypothetical protein
MFKRMAAAAAVLACAGLAACATYAPPKGAPTADLTIRRTTLIDSQQAQMFYRSADWSRRTVMGDGIMYAYDQPHPIEAGIRTYIEVEMLQYQGQSEFYCTNWFSFTPEAGHAYEVLPRHLVQTCSIEVRDLATGAVPPSYTAEMDPDHD